MAINKFDIGKSEDEFDIETRIVNAGYADEDGDIEIGLESTIVDLTGEVPVILRPGYVTGEMLSETVGEVRLDPALMTGVASDVKPKAPGMKYRHYAPRAEMTAVKPLTIRFTNLQRKRHCRDRK